MNVSEAPRKSKHPALRLLALLDEGQQLAHQAIDIKDRQRRNDIEVEALNKQVKEQCAGKRFVHGNRLLAVSCEGNREITVSIIEQLSAADGH